MSYFQKTYRAYVIYVQLECNAPLQLQLQISQRYFATMEAKEKGFIYES